MPAALLLSALLLSPPPAPPPPLPVPPADPVPALLDGAGIGYEVDGDGDYRVVFSWAQESRTQLVFVSGRSEEIAGRRIREVFSPAAQLEQAPDAQTANALLRDSRSRKLGAWEIAGDVLYYVVKLPEPLDAELLELALSVAAETADDREIEITGELDAL
ncbi:hypothetical protein CO641_06910 [Lysobacteraceae bacterium NML91-0213]|nr:hypothetical protein CO641_06910 [Xanthomonadaceae bacterium NML91-0213]